MNINALSSGIHYTGKLLMQTVHLTGEGALGLEATPNLRATTSMLPVMVSLGRSRPAARPQCYRLDQFIDKIRFKAPPAVDWYTKAAPGLARMYLNDRYGDCVIAGKMHALAIWSANDPDSADNTVIQATDEEVLTQYQGVCGRGDNGCYIPAVLDYMRDQGMMAGNRRYKIEGYVSVDWRSKDLTQAAIQIFGACCIGINLPSAWTNAAVWDTTSSRIVGGHDVTPCGYGANVVGTNADGVVISSWGRLYLITWTAWTSTRWLEEMYAMLPTFLWTGKDQQAPSGFDLSGLRVALKQLGGGTVPPLPDPLIDWSQL